MAETNLHFVELDENNVVKRGVVVGKDVPTSNGPLGDNPKHVDGETYCHDLFKGGTWKQTFKDNSLRKQYAGKGDTYDPVKDIFIKAQPYPSWALDANDDWKAPDPYPTVTEYGDPAKKYAYVVWDEAGQQWTCVDQEDPQTSFTWDASGLTWVAV
tara:strand:+ start:1483 stop:1950 length:468 start_codon:yes stop_codon:yes gene_type:complete